MALEGNLGLGFAYMSVIIGVAIILQLTILRPTTDNCEEITTKVVDNVKMEIEI